MFAYLSPFMRSVFAQGMHHVRFVIDSFCSVHPTGAVRWSCAVPRQVKNICFTLSFPLWLSIYSLSISEENYLSNDQVERSSSSSSAALHLSGGSVERENYTSHQFSIVHQANWSGRERNFISCLTRIIFLTRHILQMWMNSDDEQSWLLHFVVMRKPQQTNSSRCTWVVNRTVTCCMCSFSCLFTSTQFLIYNILLALRLLLSIYEGFFVDMCKKLLVHMYIWICVHVCLCVFVRLSSCATIWVVLMPGLMVIPLSHKSVSGLWPGAEVVCLTGARGLRH